MESERVTIEQLLNLGGNPAVIDSLKIVVSELQNLPGRPIEAKLETVHVVRDALARMVAVLDVVLLHAEGPEHG